MKNIEESVTLEVGGATLTITTRELLKAWMDKHLESKPMASQSIHILPLKEGETYAGAIINPDGTGHHVILLDGDSDGANWNAQMDWAKSIGGDLPNFVECALLFSNMKSKFDDEFYWSSEQHTSTSGYAFGKGIQFYGFKSFDYRARAVRRLEI